jgi:NAD(P)H-dependent FMN reductase
MSQLNIPILLGTGRQGRQSEKVAVYVLEQAKEFGFNSELIDVHDFASRFTVPYWEPQESDNHWRQIMRNAHGLIIVTPEYNHGYPGELKIALDKLYEEYNHKPVGICGVSSGPFGGARVIQSLKPVLNELQMIVIFNQVYFGNLKELFDAQNRITDAAYIERLKKMFEEISWYAEKLVK